MSYNNSDNQQRFITALGTDLGRSPNESLFVELGAVTNEILIAYKKVEGWAKPEGVPFDLNTFAMRAKTLKEPKGTVLIIGPFNYPLVGDIVSILG